MYQFIFLQNLKYLLMTSIARQGLSVGNILPSVYMDEEAMQMIRTPHLYFQDNYEKLFKRYGFSRKEMMLVMSYLMRVDPLVGTEILEYIE